MRSSVAFFRLLVVRRSRAVAAVEFAFIAPLLIIMLGAAVDLGRGIERAIRLESIARTAAQYVTVFGMQLSGTSAFTDVTEGDLQTLTNTQLSAISPVATLTAPNSTCYCPNTDTNGTLPTSASTCSASCAGVMARVRTITVSSSFTPFFPTSNLIPFNALGAVSRSVTVRF